MVQTDRDLEVTLTVPVAIPPVGTVTCAPIVVELSDPNGTLLGVTERLSTTGLGFTVKATGVDVDPATPPPPA
jgi:hypothetical protein